MITCLFSQNELALIRALAKKAEIGGKSHIRSNDRMSALSEDQLVGQIGTAALHKYWYGHLVEYRKQRMWQNLFPTSGDGGSDLFPANIDVKASKIRNDMPFDNYHLLIRPKERHEGWVYILALVDLDSAKCHLVGWASDDMLPCEVDKSGTFTGAYSLKANKLHPLPPVIWWKV
jgi:hypothetical protein